MKCGKKVGNRERRDTFDRKKVGCRRERIVRKQT
jgi:hypothetical protein